MILLRTCVAPVFRVLCTDSMRSLFLNPKTVLGCVVNAGLHTSSISCMPLNRYTGEWIEPNKWTHKNSYITPPQKPEEKRNPAWVCHQRTQIKYSARKMNYVAILIRGLSIEEALKQLSFGTRKGCLIAKEILLEAQELAVKDHNVEYKSNLWVADSFVTKGSIIKGLRQHAKRRFCTIRYQYCHYYVRLEEGPPPKSYYTPQLDGNQMLQRWLNDRRESTIMRAL